MVSHFVSGPVRGPLVQSLFPEAGAHPPAVFPVTDAARSVEAIVRPRSRNLEAASAVSATVAVLALVVPKSDGRRGEIDALPPPLPLGLFMLAKG